MKKMLCKAILLAVLVTCYLCIEPVHKFLSKEINTVAITNFLAENLYKDEENVASVPMVVRDYVIEESRLYIFPLTTEVSLPIDVMIVTVSIDEIEVVNLDTRYKISHITKRTGNLYQYIHSLNSFASTDDFFIVEGQNL
ncbi:MAG: hypothetical protein NC310_07910, partial [Roseburia sp.]|nr:hypothetical protein [Roseburia sp.]